MIVRHRVFTTAKGAASYPPTRMNQLGNWVLGQWGLLANVDRPTLHTRRARCKMQDARYGGKFRCNTRSWTMDRLAVVVLFGTLNYCARDNWPVPRYDIMPRLILIATSKKRSCRKRMWNGHRRN